jgi:hypothetical protein
MTAIGGSIPKIGRLYLIAFGALAAAWAVQVLPTAWQAPRLERVAGQILEGKAYKPRDLIDLVPMVDSVERSPFCRPQSLRSAAIIRLRLAEEAVKTADRPHIDTAFDELAASIRNSLRCAPSDSFLWLVLYWAESARNGFDPRLFEFLRLSYRYGPYEGWIALKRNPLALALFPQLPADLGEAAIAEFVGLVNSHLHREAAQILVGPGWQVRDKILPRLSAVAIRDRIALENAVYDLGQDIQLPGIERAEPRPWKR